MQPNQLAKSSHSQETDEAADDLNQNENLEKYLVFRLDKELYGIPLLSVKEVAKIPVIKPVPFMVSYFRGIINLHGQLVSVIDLRAKFNFKVENTNEGIILVVEADGNLIGAIVDRVESVKTFKNEQISAQVLVATKIPASFFLGIVNDNSNLINIIDIAKTLSIEDLKAIGPTQSR